MVGKLKIRLLPLQRVSKFSALIPIGRLWKLAGAFVLEVLLTAAFVMVILLVTERVAAPGFAGIAIGLALTVVHLVGIPLDGTSVNPARSFGPALFAGGEALGQVWLFILAPLVGAIVAALVWRAVRTTVDITPEDMIAGSERE